MVFLVQQYRSRAWEVAEVLVKATFRPFSSSMGTLENKRMLMTAPSQLTQISGSNTRSRKLRAYSMEEMGPDPEGSPQHPI